MSLLVALALASAWKPSPCAATTQAGAEACGRRDLAAAERPMEAEMARIARVLKQPARRRTTRAAGPKAMAIITADQRAWLAWRNAHCDRVAYALSDSSAEAIVRLDCRTKMTVERTRDLSTVARN